MGVGPIKFGMSKSKVVELFGIPDIERESRLSYMSGFMIDFDHSNYVEFIELANCNSFSATYQGQNLHSITAFEAIKHVSKFDNFDENDPELGYSYVFKKLQLSLWRATVPKNELDQDGKYFEAVAIGIANYF